MNIEEAYNYVITIVDGLIDNEINIQINPYNKSIDNIGFLPKDKWVTIQFYPVTEVQDDAIHHALNNILKNGINFNYSTFNSPTYHKIWDIDYSFEVKTNVDQRIT